VNIYKNRAVALSEIDTRYGNLSVYEKHYLVVILFIAAAPFLVAVIKRQPLEYK